MTETSGERFGRLAFAYCKIATVSLLLGRFALPVAASLSAGFFVVGYLQGKKDTRCVGRYPLGVAALWTLVAAVWLLCEFAPNRVPVWLHWVHR